ncbi:DUF2207 domain-containing protein [Janibacter sp. G56]|uniref:DUF2207 domain-containing protein n=1 Tax=Janibacter sp. G56 TaxID=3418717 RepID=UPI003CFC2B3F
MTALVGALFLLLGAPALASATTSATGTGLSGSAAADERVTAYDVDIDVREDGSIRVTEHETHRFPEGEERHGILRNITVRAGYQGRTDVYRNYELSDLEITSPTGAPTEYTESDDGEDLQLRIGSPDEVVEGTHEYVISYTLAKAVNEIDAEHVELFHNIVGTANQQYIDDLSVTVSGPAKATRALCKYGVYGQGTDCTAKAGNPSTFSHTDLGPGEGMTVAVEMPRSAFGADLAPELVEGDPADPDALPEDTKNALNGALAAGGAFIPLAAASLMGLLVWKRGRDEHYAGLTPGLLPGPGEEPVVRRGASPPVAVQFNPPPGVQPGLVGVIIDESADTVDVSATIVDLAVRGYLQMAEVENSRNDWRLQRTEKQQDGEALSAYENELLESLFAGGSEVLLSDLRGSFASTLGLVKLHMYQEAVDRGWFRRSPEAQRATWVGVGSFLMMIGVVLGFFMPSFLGIGSDLGIGGTPFNGFHVLGIGIVIAGLVCRALGHRMASRTAVGSAMLAQSRGFRRYLETAEAGQIRFEEASQIFSKFLPYAIVFGVADRWAKTFEKVAEAAELAGQPIMMPTWYVGYGPWQSGAFGGLAHGVDDFATHAAGTFVSTPGSSGESAFGSGGFGGGSFGGGGGFSGGGGSGSSGGSW